MSRRSIDNVLRRFADRLRVRTHVKRDDARAEIAFISDGVVWTAFRAIAIAVVASSSLAALYAICFSLAISVQKKHVEGFSFLATLLAFAGVVVFIAAYLGSLVSESARGLIVRVDAAAIELDGEFELDGMPARGRLLVPTADVRLVTTHHGIDLRVEGLGEIAVGRAWTFLDDLNEAIVSLGAYVSHRPASQSIDASSTASIAYGTIDTENGSASVKTDHCVRATIDWPTRFGRRSRAFRRRWPGIGLLLDDVEKLVPQKRNDARLQWQLPAIEWTVTAHELWIVGRTRADSQTIDRYPLDGVVEFRVNRFDDGLYLRVVDRFDGNVEVPGGRPATAFLLREIGPSIPCSNDRTPPPAP